MHTRRLLDPGGCYADMNSVVETAVAHGKGVTAETSFAATLLMDALRNARHVKGGRRPMADADWESGVLSPLHLPCIQQDVFRLSFCTPMTQKPDIIYLLSKIISQRCMTRKFGSVCMQTFEAEPDTLGTVKQLFLISMLGNYRHSTPSTRPVGDQRARLYDMLYDRESMQSHNKWFLYVLQHCPYLVEFTLRDYVLFSVTDDPAYERHVASLLDMESYRVIMGKTMDMARVRLSLHLRLRTPLTEMCVDMTAALQPFHTVLLGLCYRQPKTTKEILSKITSLRTNKRYPVHLSVSLSDNDEEEEAGDSEGGDGKDVDAEAAAAALAETGAEPTETALLDGSVHNITDAREKKQKTVAKYPTLSVALSVLGKRDYERLRLWVSRVAPSRRDGFWLLLRLLPLIGVTAAAAHKLGVVLEEFRVGSLNEEVLPKQMRAIQDEDPRAYDALCIMVDLFKLYTRVTLVCKLPAYMINAQLASTQNVFPDLVGTPYGVYDSSEFVYCAVCSCMYSMVRAHPLHFQRNKTYRYGLRDPKVDYDTDFIYCRSARRNVIGCCDDVPLLRFSLFGLMLQHEGDHIMLCPQPSCGAPMQLDTKHCAFTQYGPACSMCTEELGSSELNERKRLDSMESSERACHLCGVKIKQAASAYCYSEGVYLCARHHCRYIVTGMMAAERSKGWPITPEEARLLLQALSKRMKSERIERSQGKWKRDLAHQKLARCHRR